MSETILIFQVIFLVLGVIGCFVPFIPGPPLSLIAIILHHFYIATIDTWILISSTILVIVITILDFILPGITTKKYEGTKAGFWGAIIGMLAGFIIPIPGGLLMGIFLGALLGELTTGKDFADCVKPAAGSLLGVLIGTVGKLMISFAIAGYIIFIYIKKV